MCEKAASDSQDNMCICGATPSRPLRRLRADDVKSVQAQPLSVMPELLLQALTLQNVADLLEYLSSLR